MLLFGVVLCSVFRIVLSGSIQVTDRLSQVSSGVNTSLVSHTYEAVNSVLKCKRLCWKFESPSFLYVAGNQTCYCYTEVDTTVVPGSTGHTHAQYGYHTVSRIEMDDGSSVTQTTPVYKDCLKLYNEGYLDDGVYVIRPVGGVNIEVWCNQAHGGWTVIQRRMDGSEEFNRTWTDYVNGFGNVSGEYWLGLENIRLLTEESSSLFIHMRTFGDQDPKSAYAVYKTFGLSESTHYYRLVIDNFHGDCGDSMTYHNESSFSTFDADHDDGNTWNCANTAKAGWWFDQCYHSNLNGPYRHGNVDFPAERGITWVDCWTHSYSLKKVSMQIRRN